MEVSQSAASFLWTMGKGILSNGSVANNSSACISSKTKLIKDLGFVNRNTSYNGYQMNLNIVEYSGSTFLRRVSVENGSSYFLSADADSFIIMCSFISTSGVTMNDEILTSCWKVSFIDMLVNTREYAQTKNTLLKLLNDAIYVNEGNKTTFAPSNTWHSGYWIDKTANGSSLYYYSDEIDVSEGQVIEVIYNGTAAEMRFVEGYDPNGNILPSAHVMTDVTSFTIPNGCTKVVVTVYSEAIANKTLFIRAFEYACKKEPENLRLKNSFDSVAANNVYSLVSNIDVKKNCEYSFFAKFSSFDSLTIGHGRTEYGGVYLVIDDTHITTYNAFNGSQFQQFEHGLTLSDFISVAIKVDDTYGARAKVTIITNGNAATISNVIFFGSNGAVFFKSTGAMTDADFGYTIMDLKKPVYVFGDSYISLADNTKWPYYATQNGDNNMLLCGFGGATASDELKSFNNVVNLKKPRYLCWLLGMNNPDSSAINASWKSCTDSVIEYCNMHGIEIVLATIPNTPTMNNTYKNTYVKNSGYRYIDFAKAVNAESAGASWYSGMLSSDNVHPTVLGAKALWLRMLQDCPEIIQ